MGMGCSTAVQGHPEAFPIPLQLLRMEAVSSSQLKSMSLVAELVFTSSPFCHVTGFSS